MLRCLFQCLLKLSSIINILILIYSGNCSVFDPKKRTAAKIFYHLFIELCGCDKQLHIIYLIDEETLSVEIQL